MPEEITPSYSVRKIPLDTALSDSEIQIPYTGSNLSVGTDGSLSSVYIRLDRQTADSIPLARFKNFRFYPLSFEKVYVTSDAQSGKSLYLFIGREQTRANRA